MLEGPDLLWGGIFPAVCAAATIAILWRATSKAASAWRTSVLVGYLAGHWTLSARDLGAAALLQRGELEAAGTHWAYDPRNFEFVAALAKSFNASEAHHWVPLLALLAALPDAIAALGKLGPAVGWLLRAALCVFLPWRLLDGSKYLPLSLGPEFDLDLGGWSTGEAAAWIGGIGATLLLAWQIVRRGHSDGDHQDGNLRAVLATLVAFGSTITMVGAKSIVLGQLLGVLTATLAGCTLASMILRTQRGPDAAAGPLIVIFGALLTTGHFFAELTLVNAALLLAAMSLAAGWLPVPTTLSKRWRNAARAAACLLLLGVPVVLSGRELAGQMPSAEKEATTEVNPYENFKP